MAGSSSALEGYRAAVERVALFPDLRRAVVAVSGAGARRVLAGLASNDVTHVPEGRGAYAFFLDRRGRIVADLRVLPPPGFERAPAAAAAETLWLDTREESLPALTKHLRTYVPPMLAKYRATSIATHTLIGPEALEALERWTTEVDAAFRRDPGALAPLEATTVEWGGCEALAVRREEIEGDGFDLYVDPAGEAPDAASVVEELGGAVARTGGAAAARSDWDILRVERGLPLFGSELGPERLAQEAGQDERAISFAKGCFTGQEVVARIHYRGHVNRHLRGLRRTGGSFHPAADLPGTELRVPSAIEVAKPVGVITSAVDSPRFGPIGLGYVRREIDPGTVLESINRPEVAVHVSRLPFTDE